MKLVRHEIDTDMPLNMTPMIDVVFNLIIFFMVITDMSQQDLEELTLPKAIYAVPDKPKRDEWRPILNIPIEGRYVVKGDTYYDPAVDPDGDDPYRKIKQWLGEVSHHMKKAPTDPARPSTGPSGANPEIPDEALLIRADESTAFHHVQKVMELCALRGVQIWKVQLAVGESADPRDEPAPREARR